MDTRLETKGGGQVGRLHSSWPFVKLSASAHELTLSATLLGSFRFSPEQVVALEAKRSFPFLGSGLRIVHNVPGYPERIEFWCFGSPQRLIEKITALGFQPRAQPPCAP